MRNRSKGFPGGFILVHNDNFNDTFLYFKNSSELASLHKNSQDCITRVVWVCCIEYYLQLSP